VPKTDNLESLVSEIDLDTNDPFAINVEEADLLAMVVTSPQPTPPPALGT
jgi:hypothetical protein